MTRPAALNPDERAAALLRVFRARGYDAASVVELMQAAGLTKGGLYHHFPGGKEDMARAALAYVDAVFERTVFIPLASDAPPAKRLEAAAAALTAYFNSGAQPCFPAWLALGAERDRFSEAISGYFRRWIAALAQCLRDGGLSAADATEQAARNVAELHGALALGRALNDPAPFAQAVKRLRGLV